MKTTQPETREDLRKKHEKIGMKQTKGRKRGRRDDDELICGLDPSVKFSRSLTHTQT